MTTPPNDPTPPATPPIPPEPTPGGPEPHGNPAPPTPPVPSAPGTSDGSHAVSERLTNLEGLVGTLTDLVKGLLPKDERPVRKPWTHWGGK